MNNVGKYQLDAKGKAAVAKYHEKNKPTQFDKKQQIEKIRGCQVHSTVILSPVDEKVFKRLGVNVTCEPAYQKSKG